jgi:hypothetical protein
MDVIRQIQDIRNMCCCKQHASSRASEAILKRLNFPKAHLKAIVKSPCAALPAA